MRILLSQRTNYLPARGGAKLGYGLCGLVGTREPDHVVAGGDELGDDGRTEMAGRTGDENTQGCSRGRSDGTQSHHYSK